MTLPLTSHSKGLLYAIGTAVCWGILAILLKNALLFTDAETIVAFRMIYAFALSLPIVFYQYKKNPESLKIFKRPPLFLIIGSFGLAYNYLGYMKGLDISGAANAQVMIQAGPLLLMLLGFLLYKESLNPKQLFCILLAILGFYVFFSDKLQFLDRANLVTANLWILTAAASWTFYSLVIKKFTMKGYNASELNVIVFFVCALVLSLNSSFSGVANFGFYEWFFLMILGLNTLVAYGMFAAALKHAPASQVSIIITLNPILTLFLISAFSPFFDFIPYEPISVLGYLGAGLVVFGIIASIYFASSRTIFPRPQNK